MHLRPALPAPSSVYQDVIEPIKTVRERAYIHVHSPRIKIIRMAG